MMMERPLKLRTLQELREFIRERRKRKKRII